MALTMASKFSEDGKYFAQISNDGKLKIWNTVSNVFEQEFTPDYHLTSPCTCLHFVQSEATINRGGSPRKKKRRDSVAEFGPSIVLGTTSGLLLVYSVSKASLDYTIKSDSNQPINCLSSTDSSVIYSGSEQDIVVWDLQKQSVKSKWKSGNEKITSILDIPDSNKILTASKNIKLWDTESKEILKTFTGHSSDVIFLQYINPKENTDAYCLSGSRGDRLLSCWNLSDSSRDKNAVVNFLMEDIVQNVSIKIASDGSTNTAAAVRSGVVHIYQHTLNGKCGKPLKPKTTIQVVSDTGQNNEVTPIPIVGAVYRDDDALCIGHGNSIILTFENITITDYKKVHCLVRKDPRTISSKQQNDVSKSRTPIVDNDVNYLTPLSAQPTPVKRKNDGKLEIPMEKRLENLTLNKLDSNSKVPKVDNVAQLLVQGLHSKDKTIIRTVLCKREESVIQNTVKRLPMTVLVPLIQELSSMVQGKTLSSQIGSLWLKQILQVHAGILLSNPDLNKLLGPVLGSIETRLTLQTPLNRLRGRLDLLASQVGVSSSSKECSEQEEPLLFFNDKESSDSESEDVAIENHSESENEWNEETSEDEKNTVENHDEDMKDEEGSDDNEESDEEMSS